MNKTKLRNGKNIDIRKVIIFERKEKIRDELEKITDKNYADKIIRDEKTQLVRCYFKEDEIEIYKKAHKIDFKNTKYPKEIKTEKDAKIREKKILEFENKRISSFINLKERLHDESLAKEYCDKLGISNARVIVREARYDQNGQYWQGAAVHISSSHENMGNKKENIDNIMESFKNPKELRIFIPVEQKANTERYLFATRYNEKRYYLAVLDKINENEFELFDVYFKEKNSIKNNLKNGIIIEK